MQMQANTLPYQKDVFWPWPVGFALGFILFKAGLALGFGQYALVVAMCVGLAFVLKATSGKAFPIVVYDDGVLIPSSGRRLTYEEALETLHLPHAIAHVLRLHTSETFTHRGMFLTEELYALYEYSMSGGLFSLENQEFAMLDMGYEDGSEIMWFLEFDGTNVVHSWFTGPRYVGDAEREPMYADTRVARVPLQFVVEEYGAYLDMDWEALCWVDAV